MAMDSAAPSSTPASGAGAGGGAATPPFDFAQMMASLGGGATPLAGAGAAGAAGAGAGAGGAAGGGFNFAQMMQQMQGAGGMGGGIGGGQTPAVIYRTQLNQLNMMGFTDATANIEALIQTGGNVEAAVDRLLGGGN